MRSEIQQLEAITNRTPAQEQELQEKKQELARLESQQQTGGGRDPKNPNYVWLWILVIVVILLVLGIIIYSLLKDKKKEKCKN